MPTETPDYLPRQQYDEVLKKYRQQLLRSVDPTEELLSELDKVETIKDKVPAIRSAETTKEMADKLLSLPADENYKKTIGPFMTALRLNGQAHIADIFTGSKKDLLRDDSYQQLHDKLEILRSRLDPECSIVSSLQSKRVFTPSDVERIEAHKNPHKKVDKLIEILSRKSQSSFECFIAELKVHDQEHIWYILGSTENVSPPISDKDLNILHRQRGDIVRSMESKRTSFTSQLLSRGILTDVDRQRVEAMGSVHHERNEQILDILARKSERHLEMFISALVETNQEHVAQLFEDITISGTVHAEVRDRSLQKQSDAEAKLKTDLIQDLRDKESQISKAICNRGIVGAGVNDGSIRVWFKFLTRDTLDALEEGEIDKLFKDTYSALTAIHIEIPETEFKRCRQKLSKRKALMKPERQKALALAATEISDRITVDEDLLNELSLCAYRQDAILNQPTDKDKANVLLEVMSRRPDCEFRSFLNALRRTRQTDAITYINSKHINST